MSKKNMRRFSLSPLQRAARRIVLGAGMGEYRYADLIDPRHSGERNELTNHDKSLARLWDRVREKGYCDVYQADRFACAMGYHPSELYGEQYWTCPQDTEERDEEV